MAFDPNKDYMEEMKRMAAANDEAGFNAAQNSRNEKIGATGSGYPTTNYTMNDFAKQNGIATVPAVNPNPTPGRNYTPSVNYEQQRLNNEYNGNIAGAIANEKMHNQKDGDLNLGWGASGIYNYQDTQGLGGLKEAKYNEIEDFYSTPFSYDYTTDPQYQAMRRLKEKEADKTYKDMKAQYSTAFDGDIPVNMLNKMATTKGEIIDQADSYIPQLEQIARSIHADKGNQLMNQYNMLANEEQNQYNRWLGDRELYANAVRDAYVNRTNEDNTAYQRDYQEKQYKDNLEYQKWYQNNTVATTLMTVIPGLSYEEAMKRAEKINFGT